MKWQSNKTTLTMKGVRHESKTFDAVSGSSAST